MPADLDHPLAALVPKLPHPLALVLREYLEESNDYVKLWRLCEAAEMLTRFLTAAALAEIAGGGQAPAFPQELQDALLLGIRTPMFGNWVGILEKAARAVAVRPDILVPELPALAKRLLADVSPKPRTVERAILNLRNALAHDGRFPAERARALLVGHGHGERFERLWESAEAAFLVRLDLLGIADNGSRLLLRGAPDRPGDFPPYDTTHLWPAGAGPHAAGSILLARRDEARYLGRCLPLFPLQAYGPVLRNREGRPEPVTREAVAQVYARDEERVQYTALHPSEGQSEGTREMQEAFDRLFPLRAWQGARDAAEKADRARDDDKKAAREFGFRDVVEAASRAPFVGRDDHLAAALAWLEGRPSGAGLVLGPPGMGKTAFAAHLSMRIARQHKDWLCLRHFFKVDDARCSTRAFQRGVLLQLRLAGGDEAPLPDDPARASRAFLDALAAFAAAHLGPGKPHARLVLLADGLDEIAQRNPRFFELMAAPPDNVVWLGLGQPTPAVVTGLPEATAERLFGPDGLPPLDRRAVREYLLNELPPLRRKQLLDEETDEGACPFLDVVVGRGSGLPQYLHLLVEDLRAGEFHFDRPDDLPKSLSEYYDGLTAQLGFDPARMVLPHVIALLAVARAPLTAAMLASLLRDHEFRGHPKWDELFGNALRLGHVQVRSAHLWDDTAGQALDPTYRQYLLDREADPLRDFGMEPVLSGARKRVLDLCRRWRDWPEPSDEHRYALAYAVAHLKEVNDVEGLAGLVRGHYLRAVADHPALRVEGALECGRAIAEVLKDAGAERWDDFESCASQYCELAESAHASLASLPQKIEGGHVEQVKTIIASLPDFDLRGVVQLAAGVLFSEVGREDIGRRLQDKGTPLVRAQLASGGDPDLLYPYETRQLALALLEVLDGGGQRAGVGGVIPWGPIPAADVPPRTTVPPLYRALAYLAGPKLVYYVAIYTFFVFGYTPLLWALGLVGLIGWLILGIISLCPLLVLGVLMRMANGVLEASVKRIDRLMRGLDRAARAAQEDERRAILDRALRFELMGPVGRKLRTWTDLLPAWVAERFRLCATPEEKAEVVLLAEELGDSTADALASELARLEPEPLGHVLRLVLAQWFRPPDAWQSLRLVAATAERSRDDTLLLLALREYSRVTGLLDLKDAAPVLAAVPAAILARALLASLEVPDPAGWQEWLAGRPEGFSSHLARTGYLPPRAGSRAGLYVALVMAAPFLLMFTVVLPLLLLPVGFVVFLAGRMHDPYRLARACAGATAAEMRRRLAALPLEPNQVFSGWRVAARELDLAQRVSWLVAPLETRRLRDTVLAQSLLRGEAIETAGHSVGSLRRVVAALAGARLLARPAELVMNFLGDRKVLAAVAPVGRRQRTRSAREVPESKDRDELRRRLPLAPAWLSFLLVFAVATCGVLLWLVALFHLFPGDSSSWLASFGAAECIGMCAFLAMTQHLYCALPGPDSRLWPFRGARVLAVAIAYRLIVAGVSSSLFCAVDSVVSQAAAAMGVAQRGWVYGLPTNVFMPLLALLMTNLVAPELIARWRGAGLLYPSRARLWVQRLACAGLLAALAVALALVAHVIDLAGS
jgi:hypothetical protein